MFQASVYSILILHGEFGHNIQDYTLEFIRVTDYLLLLWFVTVFKQLIFLPKWKLFSFKSNVNVKKKSEDFLLTSVIKIQGRSLQRHEVKCPS